MNSVTLGMLLLLYLLIGILTASVLIKNLGDDKAYAARFLVGVLIWPAVIYVFVRYIRKLP